MRRRFWQEGPLVEINNREELEAWLRKQPHEVSVALEARAALRALPFVEEALRSKPTYIVLPVFRALAFAWGAARPSISTRGYAAPPIDLAHFSPNLTAASEAAGAAQAARAVVSNPALVGGVLEFVSNAARLADESSGHLMYAWAGDGGGSPAEWIAGPTWAKAAFWAAFSSDATRVEEDAAASVIAGSPLWPQGQHITLGLTSRSPMLLFEPKELKGQPDELQSLWQEMKAALLAAKQDWDVWIDWYEDRLAGRIRDEERELAYVRIEEALWDQGPAIVNAEIKWRIEELEERKTWIKTLANLPEVPLANRWVESGDRLVIDPSGQETDEAAAYDPVVSQLHEAVNGRLTNLRLPQRTS